MKIIANVVVIASLLFGQFSVVRPAQADAPAFPETGTVSGANGSASHGVDTTRGAQNSN